MKKLRPENRHSLIQLTAYFLWQKRGRPAGTEVDDWVLAEKLVDAALAKEEWHQSAVEMVEAHYDEYS